MADERKHSCPFCDLPAPFESCRQKHTYKGKPAEEAEAYRLPERPPEEWELRKAEREAA